MEIACEVIVTLDDSEFKSDDLLISTYGLREIIKFTSNGNNDCFQHLFPSKT